MSDRVLSQGQGDRFDRWVEFFGALVLAAATVATAWCAYQAALWSGDESKFYFEASAAQVDAAQKKTGPCSASVFRSAYLLSMWRHCRKTIRPWLIFCTSVFHRS